MIQQIQFPTSDLEIVIRYEKFILYIINLLYILYVEVYTSKEFPMCGATYSSV